MAKPTPSTEKDEPMGFYRLLDGSAYLQPDDDALDNEYCDGFRLRVAWDQIQPNGPNKFDWRGTDKTVKLAGDADKRIGLSIAGGTYTPRWVYKKGVYELLMVQEEQGVRISQPCPWDLLYEPLFEAFLNACAERYDLDSRVSHVYSTGFQQRYPMDFVLEPPDVELAEAICRRPPPDAAGLNSYASLAGAYTPAAKRFIDMHMTAFRHTRVLLSYSVPFPPENGGKDAAHEIRDYGLETYPGRFGTFVEARFAHEPPFVPPAPPELASKGSQFAYPATQVVKLYNPDPTRTRTPREAFEHCIRAGAEKNDKFMELYDLTNPEFQDLLPELRDLLLANVP